MLGPALLLSLQADLGSLSEIENSLAVFCMATYGEGDPTDNAQDFYDWLQEADVDLSGVKYAVSHLSFLQCLPGGCGSLQRLPWASPVSKRKPSSCHLVLISQGRPRCQDRGAWWGARGLVGQPSLLPWALPVRELLLPCPKPHFAPGSTCCWRLKSRKVWPDGQDLAGQGE